MTGMQSILPYWADGLLTGRGAFGRVSADNTHFRVYAACMLMRFCNFEGQLLYGDKIGVL